MSISWTTDEPSASPWTIEPLNDEGTEPCFRISAESTLFLEVCPCADGYVPGQNAANAHLIFAARDLLDAAETLLEHFGVELDRRHKHPGMEQLRQAVQKARNRS